MPLSSFQKRRRLRRTAFDNSFANRTSLGGSRLPNGTGLRNAQRANSILNATANQNRSERIAQARQGLANRQFEANQRQQQFDNSVRLQGLANAREANRLQGVRDDRNFGLAKRQQSFNEQQGIAGLRLKKDQQEFEQSKARSEFLLGLKKAEANAINEKNRVDSTREVGLAKIIAEREKAQLDAIDKQSSRQAKKAEGTEVEQGLSTIERLGGSRADFIDEGNNLTPDGQRFQAILREGIANGLTEEQASQNAYSDVVSGRLNSSERALGQIRNLSEDEYEAFQESNPDYEDIDQKEAVELLEQETREISQTLSQLNPNAINRTAEKVQKEKDSLSAKIQSIASAANIQFDGDKQAILNAVNEELSDSGFSITDFEGDNNGIDNLIKFQNAGARQNEAQQVADQVRPLQDLLAGLKRQNSFGRFKGKRTEEIKNLEKEIEILKSSRGR